MYIISALPICCMFDRQAALRALSRAWAKTGTRIAARIAMIAITTSSSISVKPFVRVRMGAPSQGVTTLRRGRREGSLLGAGAPVAPDLLAQLLVEVGLIPIPLGVA